MALLHYKKVDGPRANRLRPSFDIHTYQYVQSIEPGVKGRTRTLKLGRHQPNPATSGQLPPEHLLNKLTFDQRDQLESWWSERVSDVERFKKSDAVKPELASMMRLTAAVINGTVPHAHYAALKLACSELSSALDASAHGD